MERLVEFLDVANLESAFREYGALVDYIGLRDYLARKRNVLETFVYIPESPYQPNGRDGMVKFLRRHGFFVRSKIGRKRPNGSWKCDFDVEIAWDIFRYVERGKADTIVVACGDSDLMPVYTSVREVGIKVEVASTAKSVANNILDTASQFIDLGPVIRQHCKSGNRSQGHGAIVRQRKGKKKVA